MSSLKKLQSITTKPELANLLGISPSNFTYCLYILKTNSQYTQFKIPKKSGGFRIISSPNGMLKKIQSLLSDLLLDCLDEINLKKFPNSKLPNYKNSSSEILKLKFNGAKNKQPSLSHGFERNRSIITNAMMHLGKKYVLNIDLEDFFGSFNFGRVRGFFIKNKDFYLDPNIATVIAQIACFNNGLPQGSPCSPVITNLITHSLDIRLNSLASKNQCTYTRYADDITFSTRKANFPKSIAYEEDDNIFLSKKLRSEIKRSGFEINPIKTRLQYKDSRQDVTGLVVNKKPNTKKEYWKTVRAQCNNLFKTGSFHDYKNGELVDGNIKSLEGKLNFIDQVDHYNRLRQIPPLNPKYQTKKEALQKSQAKLRRYLHTGREVVFSKFLFYKNFYANGLPTILTEGKTDNIYLKSAIQSLAPSFNKLASPNLMGKGYNVNLNFFDYSERSRFLLELYGGADYLKDFVIHYKSNFNIYDAQKPHNPVIIFVDNDTGPKDLINYVKNISGISIFPNSIPVSDIRKADFVHIFNNLYLVFTPLVKKGSSTDIEYFFKDVDRLRKYKGRCFNTVDKRDDENDLSKDSFSKHIILENKKLIDFSNFSGILSRIEQVIDHYNIIKVNYYTKIIP